MLITERDNCVVHIDVSTGMIPIDVTSEFAAVVCTVSSNFVKVIDIIEVDIASSAAEASISSSIIVAIVRLISVK